MGIFIEECQGCKTRWEDLTDDTLEKWRFRKRAAGRPHDLFACEDFIEAHVKQCPEYARRRAINRAQEQQQHPTNEVKPQHSSRKAEPKPTSPSLGKMKRDAVEKPSRRKKKPDDAVVRKAAMENGLRRAEMESGDLEQEKSFSGNGDEDAGAAIDAQSPTSLSGKGMRDGSDEGDEALEAALALKPWDEVTLQPSESSNPTITPEIASAADSIASEEPGQQLDSLGEGAGSDAHRVRPVSSNEDVQMESVNPGLDEGDEAAPASPSLPTSPTQPERPNVGGMAHGMYETGRRWLGWFF